MHAAAKQVVKSDTNNDTSLQKAQNQMMVMMMPSPALNAPSLAWSRCHVSRASTIIMSIAYIFCRYHVHLLLCQAAPFASRPD